MSDHETNKPSSVTQLPTKANQSNKASETSSSSPVIVPTPSVTSEPDSVSLHESKMESPETQTTDQITEENKESGENSKTIVTAKEDAKITVVTPKKNDAKTKHPTKKSKRKAAEAATLDSSASDSDDDVDNNSEDEKAKKKRKRKLAAKREAAKKRKAKAKRRAAKNKKHVLSSDESSSSSDSADSDSDSDSSLLSSSESEAETKKRKLRAKAKKRKIKKVQVSSDESDSDSSDSSSSSSDSDSEDEKAKARKKRAKAKAKRKSKKSKKYDSSSDSTVSSSSDDDAITAPPDPPETSAATEEIDNQITQVAAVMKQLQLKKAATLAVAGVTKNEKPVKKNALEFKRVDQVYDMKIRDWKLVESNKDQKDEFDCVFTVRRRLDWEGKYRETQVDIKSKVLRNALQEVFKECKSISLVEDVPQIDPHTLFHYYAEIKTYTKKTLKRKLKKAKKAKKAKQKKLVKQQIAQCKLLLSYIDEDYDATRKALKPMLKAGTITYDLVWALFKPNTIAFTPTYANKDDPRCFRVDFSYEYESWMTGQKSLVVDGRYLEYDGKHFGLGDHQVQIQAFKGHKKITSLASYPLQYHKDPAGIRRQLIERGKKFVALQGMNYRLQKGIAYMKHKNSIIRFNINGRVMVDPAIFRRINPNYALSYIKQDELNQEEEQEDDEDDDCCCEESEEEGEEKEEREKMRIVMWKDKKGKKYPIRVPQSVVDKETGDKEESQLETDEDDAKKRQIFTEEELLIASPVVLGFAFSEKLWLEFSLSGIEAIKWNDEAFDSLVLPSRIKQNLKGLVSSHRFDAARTIDDVIQGKGKGLNVVLHGPPGVGKTLTGESIAEYLKCPLYAVSAGELGTNSRSLEQDLNRIMDITHSWGAILLLDEADVFLEARQPHDIHRNSLVSVFLRLTEYYQGILFLTTNRVETFDEAFQSRIHMGIRYENLSAKARKKIWQHHVGKVEKMSKEKAEKTGENVKTFTEADYDELAKRVMNGRQIKNMVKTSQSIALAEKTPFGMEHVKRVLEVAEAFEDDMRGGKGYRDAMRQYT